MYSRVLVPLDGSTTALQVLPYARMLAKATGAKIELLEALHDYPREFAERVSHEIGDSQPIAYPPSMEVWSTLQDSVRKDATLRLAEAAAALRSDGLTVETNVVEIDPADAIVAEAEREPDTLIAISTHGRSGIGRWVLGSVTDKVIRHSTTATLVVRAREREVTSAAPTLTRVVLPLDGSEMGDVVIPHAVASARALGIGITLIRSISPLSYGDTFADYVPSMYEDLATEIEEDVRDYLSQQAAKIREMGIADVSERAVDGYAASVILDEVGDDGDKLVVMATHGRSGIGRLVLGSVTDRVVRHSPGPVLVVRPTNHA